MITLLSSLVLLSADHDLHPSVRPDDTGTFGLTMGTAVVTGASSGAYYVGVWDNTRFDFGLGYARFSGGPTAITELGEFEPHFNLGVSLYGGINLTDHFSLGVGIEGPSFLLTDDMMAGKVPTWTQAGGEITWNTGRYVDLAAHAGYCFFGDVGNVCGSFSATFKIIGVGHGKSYVNL